MFGKKKKKDSGDSKPDLSRRNFLKGAAIIPAGVVVAVAGTSMASTSSSASSDNSSELKADYFKKSWVEDGINYAEYELPENVHAFFKHPEGRDRAIEVPIYNLDKECGTKEELLENLKNYIKMHQKGDPGIVGGGDEAKLWGNPYCYIINIKNNEKLFGAMINKEKLEFETNIYTVYK